MASIWRLNDQNIWVTSQNYESDQIIVHCIDLTSKRSKCWDTSQNIQNNAKLQKWSNYNALHRFDVKTIQKCWVTSQNIQNNRKTTKWSNYRLHRFDIKTIQNLRYVAKHQNNAKLRKWSNYNALHRFDV